jgi:predicted ATP-binding protein involved in virulence
MSKAEATKEAYGVYKQNVNRYFEEAEKSVAQYIQAMSNLQQEFATSYKNAVESAIEFQHEAATKSGLNANLPPSFLKAINDATEEIVKTTSVQNKAVITAMEAARQNIKTFNDNLKAFTTMDANILQSWFSAWTPSRN